MGGYIIVRVFSGFTDALSLLWYHTKYAKQYNRTIIFSLSAYTATDLESILDFSEFPVPVLCGEKHIENIPFDLIEPSCFENDPYKPCDSYVKHDIFNIPSIGNMITRFDIEKQYPDTTLLIFQGFGNLGQALETMKHIKFTSSFLEKFRVQRNLLPDKYISIHLRATDYPGYNEETDIAKVDVFILKNPNEKVYIASDNTDLVNKLADKYSQIVKPLSFKTVARYEYYSIHYSFGDKDPDCLSDALIDILMCASGTDFLQSRGGFSDLIIKIKNTPELLNKLLHQ